MPRSLFLTREEVRDVYQRPHPEARSRPMQLWTGLERRRAPASSARGKGMQFS
jgi:hypothetical protein